MEVSSISINFRRMLLCIFFCGTLNRLEKRELRCHLSNLQSKERKLRDGGLRSILLIDLEHPVILVVEKFTGFLL
jgi:hypothetical protein